MLHFRESTFTQGGSSPDFDLNLRTEVSVTKDFERLTNSRCSRFLEVIFPSNVSMTTAGKSLTGVVFGVLETGGTTGDVVLKVVTVVKREVVVDIGVVVVVDVVVVVVEVDGVVFRVVMRGV